MIFLAIVAVIVFFLIKDFSETLLTVALVFVPILSLGVVFGLLDMRRWLVNYREAFDNKFRIVPPGSWKPEYFEPAMLTHEFLLEQARKEKTSNKKWLLVCIITLLPFLCLLFMNMSSTLDGVLKYLMVIPGIVSAFCLFMFLISTPGTVKKRRIIREGRYRIIRSVVVDGIEEFDADNRGGCYMFLVDLPGGDIRRKISIPGDEYYGTVYGTEYYLVFEANDTADEIPRKRRAFVPVHHGQAARTLLVTVKILSVLLK